MKKISVLLSIILISLCFTSCTAESQDFNAYGYIKAVLDNTYKADFDGFVEMTNSSDGTAEENHSSVINNYVVKFFEKYGVNPSDEQITELGEVIKKMLLSAQYTVQEQTETTNGYSVVVAYSPISNMLDLDSDIRDIVDNSGDYHYLTGAPFIDEIIDLCDASANNVDYLSEEQFTFEVLVASNRTVSMNITLFDILDDLILPM